MDVEQGVEAVHGGSRAVGRQVKAPRFARRKASRQPACYAVRPRRVRAVALCLWCGPSDGRGGGASAAAIRQTRPGAPPRPSAYPRRGLMPPRPRVLCAPKDFGEETAFDLISRLHHYIHESLRLCKRESGSAAETAKKAALDAKAQKDMEQVAFGFRFGTPS